MAKSTLPASEGKAAASVDDQTKDTDWDKWFKQNESRLSKIESVLDEVKQNVDTLGKASDGYDTNLRELTKNAEKDGQRIDALAKQQPKLGDKGHKGDEARFANIERMLGIPHSPDSEDRDAELDKVNAK